jgi:hypothetical protein
LLRKQGFDRKTAFDGPDQTTTCSFAMVTTKKMAWKLKIVAFGRVCATIAKRLNSTLPHKRWHNLGTVQWSTITPQYRSDQCALEKKRMCIHVMMIRQLEAAQETRGILALARMGLSAGRGLSGLRRPRERQGCFLSQPRPPETIFAAHTVSYELKAASRGVICWVPSIPYHFCHLKFPSSPLTCFGMGEKRSDIGPHVQIHEDGAGGHSFRANPNYCFWEGCVSFVGAYMRDLTPCGSNSYVQHVILSSYDTLSRP